MTATYRQFAAGCAVLLALGLAPVDAAAPVPRDAPDFTIVEPSGRTTAVSSFKGQVVLLEFMFVKCQRCTTAAQTIDKLYAELGPRGFQPVALAFDNGLDSGQMDVFRKLLKIDYLFGTTTAAAVDHYLGRAPMERFQLPQMVLIDRAGVIRTQSLPIGETKMLDEAALRQMIEQLLDEAAPSGKSG